MEVLPQPHTGYMCRLSKRLKKIPGNHFFLLLFFFFFSELISSNKESLAKW